MVARCIHDVTDKRALGGVDRFGRSEVGLNVKGHLPANHCSLSTRSDRTEGLTQRDMSQWRVGKCTSGVRA